MGRTKPHRYKIVEDRYPVRLRIAVEGGRLDHRNETTRRFLEGVIGAANYAAVPAPTAPSGQRCVFLYFRNLQDPVRLLLACPHLRLVSEPYHGPAR